jgi:hypothetical protein
MPAGLSLSLTLAYCVYPSLFAFISDNPYEAIWKVCACCAAALGVEAVALFRVDPDRSPRTLARMVAGACAIAVIVTVVAGIHTAVGLACPNQLNPLPGTENAAAAEAQTVAILTLLTLVILGAALVLVPVGLLELHTRYPRDA